MKPMVMQRGRVDPRGRPPWKQQLKRRLVQVGVLLYRAALAAAPARWDPSFARFLVHLVRFVRPRLEGLIDDHLRLVYGQGWSRERRRELASRVLRNAAAGVTEFMRMPQLSPDDVRRRVEIRGKVHLHRAIAAGHGAILTTGHYGNFEMMAACCGAFGLSLVAIARPRDDDTTEQFINATRSQHRVQVVSRQSWRAVLRALRDNQLVGILADQAVLVGGVMADFLGRPAATALGPFVLARHSGAPILPCFVTRDPNGRFTVSIHPPLDVPDSGDERADMALAAQRLNDVLSAQILHRPEEWLWMHRRWKTPLTTRNDAPRLGDLARLEPKRPGRAS